MVELTTRQEAKVITFTNKAYQSIGDLADKARLEDDRKEVKKIVTSGMKLGIFLLTLDDKRTDWSTLFTLRTIDRYIDEFNLFKIPFNPAQLSFDNITTRILGETGDGSGEFATTLQLNSEAAARVNQDNNLQDQIDTLDLKVDNLDFSTLVPATAVFSEPTPGYKDFPTELGINLPNKTVLDQLTQLKFDDIGLNTTHRNNADIHVTASQKNDWDSKVTPEQLSSGLAGKAALNHTHTIGQVQSLQSELDQLAQDIISNAAEDGVTPNISIGNVVSGSVPSVSLGSASTAENPILDFVLVPGEQGEQGEPFQFDAIDFLANRSNYVSEPFGFSFVDVETGLVYYKEAGAGIDSWSGGIRTIGDRGWTPVHVLEPIDGKAYLKLVDYIDGQGVKPTRNIGAYVSPNGYVISPVGATNLKGNKGDSPVQGIDYEIPRFKIDATLTYSQYLVQASTLLSNKAIGYTIQFDGSVSPYENKNGMIAILSRNASTGAREWREYEFQGEQGESGVPGPPGPSAEGVYKVLTVTSHGFVEGDVLVLNGASYEKAVDTELTPIGIVVDVIDANQFKLWLSGWTGELTGLTPDSVHYISATGDITDVNTGRPILHATSQTNAFLFTTGGAGGGTSGALVAANNLADLDDVALARTNLDVYSKVESEAINPTELSTFDSVLDFTKNTTIRHTVAGAIEFTLGASPVLGKKAIFYFVADGLNKPTVGTGFVEKFDNYVNTLNRVNRLYFEYVGNNTVMYEWHYV